MEFTGERFIPGQGGAQIAYEHLLRYLFALEAVKGKRVLDLGSGEGCAAFLIAQRALQAIGVDIAPEAVAHASAKYVTENLRFVVGSACALPFREEDTFDVITCFEVIEHVPDPEALVREAKRVLRPGGLLLISTPNKKTYTDDPQAVNPFHVKEFYFAEFRELLERYFQHMVFYGQHLAYGSALRNLSPGARGTRIGEVVVEMVPEHLLPVRKVESGRREPLYFVTACSDEPIPRRLIFRSFYLNDQSRLMQVQHEMAVATWQQETAAVRKDLERTRAESAALEANRDDWEAQCTIAEHEKASVRAQQVQLQEQVTALEVERARLHGLLGECEQAAQAQRAQQVQLQEQVTALEVERTRLHGLLAGHEQAAQALRIRLQEGGTALEAERSSWQAQVDTIRAERGRLQDEVVHLRRELDAWQEQAQQAREAHAATVQSLHAIQTSIAWRAILRYRTLLDRLLPSGTRRRRGYRRLVTAAAGLCRTARGREGSPVIRVQRDHHEADPALKTEEKTLTIICASYKRYREIHVLINSLLCQTLNNWKLLIVHDGYDETMEAVLRSYRQQHPHIELVFTEKRHNDYGHSLREMGLARVQTEFVMFTNDDNYYAPRFLEYMFEAIRHHKLDLVLCNMIHSHKNPGKYRQDDYHLFDSFPRMCYIDIGNFIVRRNIAQEVSFTNKSFSADGVFIERIINSYNVVNLIPGWRWKLSLLRKQRWAPNRKAIRVGKVDRVLFVHN